MKLNIKAFGLTCGLVWGIGLFVVTWWIIAFEGSTQEITFIGHVYRGYSISPAGSIVGAAWAFADGLLGGVIFAWLYNLLAVRLKKAESTQQG
ncbi:MAG: bacteriophage holin [Planctomycetota bacterium]